MYAYMMIKIFDVLCSWHQVSFEMDPILTVRLSQAS